MSKPARLARSAACRCQRRHCGCPPGPCARDWTRLASPVPPTVPIERGPSGGIAAVEIRGAGAVVASSTARQRAVLVHRLRHQRHGRDVAVVPQAAFDVRRQVAGVVDLHFLGADDAPAALGLHPAHGGSAPRHAVAHAIAVRHLVEAVRRGDRTDLHRLKQTIERGWLPAAIPQVWRRRFRPVVHRPPL